MDQGWRQKRRLNMLAMFVLAASLAGCSGKERTLYSPPAFIKYEHPPPPAVRVIVPVDGTTFHAHADIRLLALATPYGTSLGPDEDGQAKPLAIVPNGTCCQTGKTNIRWNLWRAPTA